MCIRDSNYSVKGLRMGISGYIGNSFQNDIIKDEKSTKYKDVKGTVVIGASVSYTHLDVYKRQLPHSSVNALRQKEEMLWD